MGAKFNKRQPAQLAGIKDKQLYVKDILGEMHYFPIDLEREYQPSCSKYLEEVFVHLEDETTIFVCRYNRTYTVYRKSDNLILAFGIVKAIDPELFNISYITCGYARDGKSTEILIMEERNKKVVHAVISDVAPAHKTYTLTAPLDSAFNLLHSSRLAHVHPEFNKRKNFITTTIGNYPENYMKLWRCYE